MGLFDDHAPDPDATSTFEPMDEGVYNFKIESIGDNAVLVDTKTGKKIWQRMFENTEAQLIKAFGTEDLIGATAELEVKHTVSKRDDNTYANVQLPFLLPEPGNYRVRIKEVVEGMTKKTPKRKMATVTLELSGSTNTVRYWVVVANSDDDQDTKNMFDGMVNSFMNSFDGMTIKTPTSKWVGKVAGAKIGHETSVSGGETYENAVVKKWLALDEQRDLPAWGGGAATETASVAKEDDIDEDFIPFG